MERSMEEGRGGREGFHVKWEFGGRGSSEPYSRKGRETGGAVRGLIGAGRIPVSYCGIASLSSLCALFATLPSLFIYIQVHHTPQLLGRGSCPPKSIPPSQLKDMFHGVNNGHSHCQLELSVSFDCIVFLCSQVALAKSNHRYGMPELISHGCAGIFYIDISHKTESIQPPKTTVGGGGSWQRFSSAKRSLVS